MSYLERGIKMKSKSLLLCLGLSIVFSNFLMPLKAEENNKNEIIVDSMFSGLDENDKVLELPDGGFLYGGQATVVDSEDESIILGVYNSETDPNSITVEEAKEILLEESENPIQARGASLPSQTYVLQPGVAYQSNAFSGTGWRFGGYYFKSGGNGDWLKWSTYKDDGRVGDIGDGLSVLNNASSTRGTNLYVGYPQYLNASSGLVYFTYNPKSGTYYKVENN